MSSPDRDEILRVNNLFYRALGTRDLKLMEKVWINDERAGCVHPGWTILRSWEAIMQSWENVFDPEDQVDINLSSITLNIKGDIAWVTCIQEMTYIKRNPVMFNISQSTNIFEKTELGWEMLIHHASPLPTYQLEEKDTNLQ